MTTKSRILITDTPAPGDVTRPGRLPPPMTTEERVVAIEMLRQRVNDRAQFMCRLANMKGTSTEAKDKAIAAFCDLMTMLEQRLGRIQEDLELG